MLETLTQGFDAAKDRLRGVRTLTEENIDEALRDVRSSLLEADVGLPVVRSFLKRIKERARGEKVETRGKDAKGRTHRASPTEHFVAICEEELATLMGPVDPSLAKGKGGLTSVLLLGLQGVGKTTVAAKLARLLKSKGQKPLLVAADIYRPAAILQLQKLGESIDVPVHAGAEGEAPVSICTAGLERAKREGCNAIIYDTAGRLAIDDTLMQELEQIKSATEPANSLLVCDSLMGRDAVNVAQAFAERLPLDGLVLTKLDGDARGGAALAIKEVTGVPIKFIGVGETLDKLEEFRPEGLASRILGMGDVVGLVKDFEAVVDEKEAEADAEKMLAGQFTFEDFLKQLKTIQKMGSMKDLLGKLPGMGSIADQVDDRELGRVEAMVHSMTRAERAKPELIDKSRSTRIARGSGHNPKEVRDLVQRFKQMRDIMGTLGSGGMGGMLSRVPGLGKLAGGMGGMPGMGDMGGMAGFDPAALLGGGGGPGLSQKEAAKRRSAGKKKRKQARKDRKKGRKK